MSVDTTWFKYGREPEWSRAHFAIVGTNLASAWTWRFKADRRWLVAVAQPFADLVPFSASGADPVPLEEVAFLADCVSFDHDMPSVVRPLRGAPDQAPPVKPAVDRLSAHPGMDYFDTVAAALSMVMDVRFGDVVELRYYSDEPKLPRFNRRFAGRESRLALYAMATRQVDLLSEYLCLYRVLETPGRDDGIAFIENHLAEIGRHDFGVLYTHDAVTGRGPNVFEVYRQRALTRLGKLRNEGKDTGAIARHL